MATPSEDLKVSSESDNSVETLLREFETRVKSGELTGIMMPSLASRVISTAEAKHLADILMSGICREGLYVKLNNCKLTAEGVRFIAEALGSGKCPDELGINLSGVELGPLGIMHFANAMFSGKCPKGLCLNLYDTNTQRAGMKFLSAVLSSGRSPERLSLELGQGHRADFDEGELPLSRVEEPLGEISAILLAEALRSGQSPKGLTLRLKDHMGSFDKPREWVRFFAGALLSGNSPEDLTLHLDKQCLGAEEIKLFAEALKSGKCREGLTLDFGNNRLGSAGAKLLAEALKSGKCPKRLTLRLNSNDLEVEGVRVLAQALASGQCPEGLTLDLWGNQLSSEEAKLFAEALQSGKCPQGLTLSLGSHPGAKFFLKALQSGKCPKGLTLIIDWLKLTEEDQKSLIELLLSNECPLGLNISPFIPEDSVLRASHRVKEVFKTDWGIDRFKFDEALTCFAKGWRCECGIGAERDLEKAYEYYRKAMEFGYLPAQQQVKRLLQEKPRSESSVQTSAQPASVAGQSKVSSSQSTATAAAAAPPVSTLEARPAVVEKQMSATQQQPASLAGQPPAPVYREVIDGIECVYGRPLLSLYPLAAARGTGDSSHRSSSAPAAEGKGASKPKEKAEKPSGL